MEDPGDPVICGSSVDGCGYDHVGTMSTNGIPAKTCNPNVEEGSISECEAGIDSNCDDMNDSNVVEDANCDGNVVLTDGNDNNTSCCDYTKTETDCLDSLITINTDEQIENIDKNTNHNDQDNKNHISSPQVADGIEALSGPIQSQQDRVESNIIIDSKNKDSESVICTNKLSRTFDPDEKQKQSDETSPNVVIENTAVIDTASTLSLSHSGENITDDKDCLFVTGRIHPEDSKPGSSDAAPFNLDSPGHNIRRGYLYSSSNTEDDDSSPYSSPKILDHHPESKPTITPTPPSPPPPTNVTPSIPSTSTTPCPPSPHLRRKFSATGKTPNPQHSQITTSAIAKEAEMETKNNPTSSPSKTSNPTKSIPPSQSHHKGKMSKMSGCFHRFGSLGRKKKRKLSPREDVLDTDCVVGDEGACGNKENLEVDFSESSETKQDKIGGKIPKVCDEEAVLVCDKVPECQIEINEESPSTMITPVIESTEDNIVDNNRCLCVDDDNTNNTNDDDVNDNNNNHNDDGKTNNENEKYDITNPNNHRNRTSSANENDGDEHDGKEETSQPSEPEVNENSEEIDTVSATLIDDPFKFSRIRIRPGSFRFRRAFSQRTRMKPLLENVVSGNNDKDDNKVDDDDDIDDLDALQFTAAADNASEIIGRGSRTFHRRAFSLKLKRNVQTSSTPSSSLRSSAISDNPDVSDNNVHKNFRGDGQSKSGNKHQRRNQQLHRSQSLKTQLMSFFVNLHGNHKASPLSRTGSANKLRAPGHDDVFRAPDPWSRDQGPGARNMSLTKHSLASVELSSWASRGSARRSGNLASFSSTLNPLGMTTRAEILQTISSAIIALFQRKRLKENELGLLQEHVRFLIEAEAGELIYEYYKDQLLRKGMVILREKIKNEQGLELLTMLGETWDYFFREILPNLQAILYPLTPVLANDESIRSLSLLSFRNIVVLKVSIREALDSVSKHSYPSSIQQMLLILQGITDNVFLSENQFLLEKLVARVVCPYMGQRGVYEGGPEPVIKVKLKPLPLNIPLESSDPQDNKILPKPEFRKPAPSQSSTKKSGAVQNGNGEGGAKLKTVLEHLQDNGRRHSVVT